MTYIITVKHYLDHIDPKLWYLLVPIIIGGLIHLYRWKFNASFTKLPAAIKTLPALLIGAIVQASTSEDLSALVINTIVGVFLGLAAVGGYEAKVRLTSGAGTRDPGPAVNQAVPPNTKITITEPAPAEDQKEKQEP